MYKIIENNQIIDVMKDLHFVKYLPKTKKSIIIDERQANGVLSSNNSVIYHIEGTPKVFPEETKTVNYCKIDLEEYERLTQQLKANNELLERVNELEKALRDLQKKLDNNL